MMKKSFAYGSFALLILVGVNCGGGGGTSVTVSSFCNQKAEKECGTATTGVASNCGATVAACTAARVTVCLAATAAQMSLTRPFHPENISACLSKTAAAYQAATVTPALRLAMDEACARVFSGSNKGAATDPACTNDYECVSPLICDRAICAKKTSSAANDFCNDPGATCPTDQYCTGVSPAAKCTPKKTAGLACSATAPCIDTLRCAAGACVDKVAIGLACTSDDDCAVTAPYCDPFNGNKCYRGFTPSIGTNECAAFGATDTGGGGAPGGVGGAAGGAGGSGDTGGAGGAG